MTRIPEIPTEYTEAIGWVVIMIIVAMAAASIIDTMQRRAEQNNIRDRAEDIAEMIRERDKEKGVIENWTSFFLSE